MEQEEVRRPALYSPTNCPIFDCRCRLTEACCMAVCTVASLAAQRGEPRVAALPCRGVFAPFSSLKPVISAIMDKKQPGEKIDVS